jgi:hypothetical protein
MEQAQKGQTVLSEARSFSGSVRSRRMDNRSYLVHLDVTWCLRALQFHPMWDASPNHLEGMQRTCYSELFHAGFIPANAAPEAVFTIRWSGLV